MNRKGMYALDPKVTFIHSADLHLDSPFKGLSHIPNHIFHDVRESTFRALTSLVELAIDKNVDFVLMVGDLFDSDKQSLKAQMKLKQAFEKLKSNDIHVYASYGNHDYLNGSSHSVQYPDNVHIFEKEQVSYFTFYKDNEAAANIYGFSYENRAVLENKSESFVRSGDAPLHIGMLHGSIRSNTEHDMYAPFNLSDLTEKPFDYWALGHIHKRRILAQDPPTVYPGNVQGRSKKELGEKGAYYVELDRGQHGLTFFPLQQIRFEKVEIDVSTCGQLHEMEQLLVHKLQLLKERNYQLLLSLQLIGAENLEEWHLDGYLVDMIEMLNEDDSGENWVYIINHELRVTPNWDEDELKQGQHFVGELLRGFEECDDLHEFLYPLQHHKQARKYLEGVSDYQKREIIQEAKDLLLYRFLKE